MIGRTSLPSSTIRARMLASATARAPLRPSTPSLIFTARSPGMTRTAPANDSAPGEVDSVKPTFSRRCRALPPRAPLAS